MLKGTLVKKKKKSPRHPACDGEDVDAFGVRGEGWASSVECRGSVQGRGLSSGWQPGLGRAMHIKKGCDLVIKGATFLVSPPSPSVL